MSLRDSEQPLRGVPTDAVNTAAVPRNTALIPSLPNTFSHLPKVGKPFSTIWHFACIGCNGFKLDKTKGYDAISQANVPLYHPRIHQWAEHFAWNDEFTHIVPLTAIGRVTVAELQLNREGVVNVRLLLIMAGLHPPAE
jgi:hypothetical protein